ncbi:unnamed protein product [Closterium sp. NIES-65]|nr:unnamed protein product [Closterium sp. NIES-65]
MCHFLLSPVVDSSAPDQGSQPPQPNIEARGTRAAIEDQVTGFSSCRPSHRSEEKKEPASPPDVSSLYIVRLRSAPPVASYRGGFPGFPATAVWDSDPNGCATDAASDGAANGSVAVGAASVSSSAAGAATTSGLGWLGRRPRRPRVNVRAPGVRAFKQLLQRMQQAVLRDSGVAAGKMLYRRSKRGCAADHIAVDPGKNRTAAALCVSRACVVRDAQATRRHVDSPSPASGSIITSTISPPSAAASYKPPSLRPSTPSSFPSVVPPCARQPFPLARVDNVSATLTPAQRMTTYMHASNGFSATLTPAQVQRMRRHPSVASVTQARVVRPATTHSYKFLGLPGSLWADAGGPSSAGDGTVIGIVDTGIWPEHASFDDTGYSSTLPAGWSGTCPTTSDFTCNKKIIGGGVFHAGFESGGNTIDLSADWDSPRDSFGHGTWCAG